MSRITTSLLASLFLLAACGDDNGGSDDDPQPVDAADVPEIDATVCEPPKGYPERVGTVTIELEAPHHLTLDGTGTRCEQIVEALFADTGRPPALSELDASVYTVRSCEHDDVTDREIVRIDFPEYGGVEVFGIVQEVLAHVDTSDDVVFLAGDYIPAGHAPAEGCLDTTAVAEEIPGESLGYTTFAACTPQDEGTYEIAASDDIEVGDEGVYLDQGGNLRRVRAVDVYLHEDHVTDDTINSDLYCCDGTTGVAHCVGSRLFVDVLTGEVVGSEGHCITC